ncbi:MAG TPA: SAF domain-containing protein [bacterium]|nr:SAF domain-containing protein [bacterium]
MNLHQRLLEREAAGTPLRVALIGAGKFGSMFLSQIRRTPGLHLIGVADLAPERARANLQRVGWPAERLAARSPGDAVDQGTTWVGDDATVLIQHPAVDVAIDATGHPPAGIAHALAAIANGKHIVMVNVEADALAGPWLARKAKAGGVVYSLAYGDQPALIVEQVDWARTCGFEVVAAGKGTKYLPAYHQSTPETVWTHYGLSAEQARLGGMNPQMFNSFIDGTKSGIEMAAVANATGLTPAPDGLRFPPCAIDDLPRVLRPETDGGALRHKGQVEVVSSVARDGTPVPRNLRWGVYVVFEAASDYVRRCFAEYGIATDPEGRYAALYRPSHLVGLELGVSVASVGLRGEPTGAPTGFRGDVVATAKRDLAAGTLLDGEGGFTVWGKLLPAAESLRVGGLPIGLADGVTLRRAVTSGAVVRWSDVVVDESSEPVRVRREMEAMFAADLGGPASTT